MHDRTRIAVCRWAFLALCVVPTCLVLGLIVFHWLTLRSPAAKSEWERELSRRLGVTVRIERLSYPQPDVADLAGVTITDPETGIKLATCRAATIERMSGQWQVTLDEPVLESSALTGLAHRFHERWLLSSEQALPVDLRADRLTIQGTGQAQSLADLAARFVQEASGPKLELEFKLPGATKAVELTAIRNRQITPPATQITWKFPVPVPVDLAGRCLPPLGTLGPQATISGDGVLRWQDGRLDGELALAIAAIDLSRLVSDRFPHVLSGSADLACDGVKVDAGRVTSARGTLVAGRGGRISRSLLLAARDHLQLDAAIPGDDADSLPFDRLSLRFETSGEQLRLSVGDAEELAILSADGSPLLSAPDDHQVPVVALARMLLPDSQLQVPAAKQTAALLALLPLPAAQPQSMARSSGHVPTRLGPASPARRRESAIRERPLR